MKKGKLERLQKQANQLKIELESKATDAENHFIDILRDNDIIFEFQKVFIAHDRFVFVDFFIETKDGRGLIIEIDGFYHFNYKQRKLDLKRKKWLIHNFGCYFRRYANGYAIRKMDYLLEIVKSFDVVYYGDEFTEFNTIEVLEKRRLERLKFIKREKKKRIRFRKRRIKQQNEKIHNI